MSTQLAGGAPMWERLARTGNSVQACNSAIRNKLEWAGGRHGRHGVCGPGRVRAQQRDVEHRHGAAESDSALGPFVSGAPAAATVSEPFS